MDLATPENLRSAADYLSAHDPILLPVIQNAGLCTIQPHTDYYQALCNSIIGQQLSVKAAATIKERFRACFGGTMPTPETLLEAPLELLQSAGLSRTKATYIHDLARHICEHHISFETFPRLSNEEILTTLTDVKGIGVWTAHMFLMFCMGRLDVLPIGDLGIRSGIRLLYGLRDLPTPEQVTDIATAHHWHPYESVASWYVWHARDNAPEQSGS